MICEPWSVVVVPFPFTDRQETKRRPALVLSARPFNAAGHSVMAMITSQAQSAWPGDSTIDDLASAGLPVACLVRLKLFTLDNRLILKHSGQLSISDQARVTTAIRGNIGWTPARR